MPVYLDCNATTPLDPAVQQQMLLYLQEELGNAGSRTHEFGQRAKQAVERARHEVAAVVGAESSEVIFTSGATESNNLAILGLLAYGETTGRRHLVSTQVEHKAVLEPLEECSRRGFEVTLVPPTAGGWIDPAAIREAVREDTLLVSVMHVNNETGVRNPLPEIADVLADHPTFLHVDAAQGFGKDLLTLQNLRLDLISVSGHKIYGPKGIGALIARRRGFERPPLRPLIFGGGQERGLRPGTHPVPLIVGLGCAAAMSREHSEARRQACAAYRQQVLQALAPLGAEVNGDPERSLPHVLNLVFQDIDSEALMLALKPLIAISNGSACTSASYEPSHVLKAMGYADDRISSSVRISWYHGTDGPDWEEVASVIAGLR
jgi:cysteine desulfurase